MLRNKLKALAVAVGVAGTSAYVHAASILPTDIDTQFADAKTDMVKIFGLMMVLVLALTAWRYIRAAAR